MSKLNPWIYQQCDIFFLCRTNRLGNKGVKEVQSDPFFSFKNDQWDFKNIRDCVPPIVCELSGDDDTRNFDDVENEAPNEDFPTPKAFAGNHLPFVGFTYSKDYQLLSGSIDSASFKPQPPSITGRVSFHFTKLFCTILVHFFSLFFHNFVQRDSSTECGVG